MRGLRWVGDPILFGLLVLLSVGGILMIYSAGALNIPDPVTEGIWIRQLAWFGISLTAYFALSRVGAPWIEWIALPAYGFALLLLAISLLIGTGFGTAEGTRSFIQIAGFRFQPAEPAKVATALALARVLAARPHPPAALRDLILPGAIVATPMLLVLLQPDLGSALAFVGILFAALFWSGTPTWLLLLVASPVLALLLAFDTTWWSGYMILAGGLLLLYRSRIRLAEGLLFLFLNVVAGAIAQPLWNSLQPYQQNRLLVFLDPSVDPRGAGWHLLQSKVAIGSGGLLGKGFTEGTQKRLAFLPEQHTDFIFSVIGEELGFLGVAAFLFLFAALFLRLVQRAERTPDPFAGLVAFGILGSWIVHVFVNIGMTTGLVPVTGIPLPFVSYGGSFLLACWLSAGIVVRVLDTY